MLTGRIDLNRSFGTIQAVADRKLPGDPGQANDDPAGSDVHHTQRNRGTLLSNSNAVA
jgi:hypothetical protein